MHYYQHHIGDFIRDTSRLNDAQCMSYLRLLWMYYESEKPLPNKPKILALKIGAEVETVELLLEAFFTLKDDVWVQTRCDDEIAKYTDGVRTRNQENGKKGGRPKKNEETQKKPNGLKQETLKPKGNPKETHWVSSGNPEETQEEPIGNPNHKPLTTNQEPLTKNQLTCLQSAKAARPKTETDESKKIRQEVWQAYSDAYFRRYGTEPLRNAKVNGQVAQFCKRLPADEAPHVAAFYLTHPNRWYVQKGHEFGQLLNEAEKLRTEWATNRKVTARESSEEDRLGGMAQAVAEIKAEMGWGQA